MMKRDDEFRFASRRSPVLGRRGMVATSQVLAAAAGTEVLRRGGTAADAAVATAAALNVTEPTSTGIGGDAFALHFDGSSGVIAALNGSGRAPAALTLDRAQRVAREAGGDEAAELPPYHPLTVTVPGACAAWCDLLEAHGHLPLEEVFAPAIRLAESGFPVAPVTAHFWARGAERQLRHATGGDELLIDGRAPRAGEVFRNPGLARMLRAVASDGAAAFYTGRVAEAIERVVRDAGGVLTREDLAAHRSEWVSPISTTYRGFDVWECPPNTQGVAALLALNLLEGFDLREQPALSSARLHLQIEAMRLAFADARWFVADPQRTDVPLRELLSNAYARERARLLDPAEATADVVRGQPSARSGTVYLAVVDGDGNACSFIASNYMGFGTGLVPRGWGFTLQNRGLGFSLEPDHPNVVAPGKRPYHTIIPGLITKRGAPSGGHKGVRELHACFGVMGGFMQPQGHLQVLSGLIDDRLDPQAALDRPRWCIADGVPAGRILVEEGMPEDVIDDLARRGHDVARVSGYGRSVFGRGQIIVRDASSGVLWGGSDPRADGCALPVA